MHLSPERSHARRWMGLSCFLLALALPVQAETELTVANSNWEPYYGDTLPGYGIAGRLLSHIFEPKDVSITFLTMPWAQAMRRLELGMVDAVATAYDTPQRREDFYLSAAYDHSQQFFYQRQGSDIEWQQLEDLEGFTIGLIRDHAYSEEIDESPFLQREFFNDERQLLAVLAAQRVDLVLLDERVAEYELSSAPPALAALIEQVPRGLESRSLHLMFSGETANGEALRDSFDQGLEKLRDSGELEALRQAN
ncbi:MAG: hypothetical protein EA349_06790 [Halomonadaceae bacterium]|nr:MAG: hypothetical protein EA349_06790 [Halomonadaceae bacterium]